MKLQTCAAICGLVLLSGCAAYGGPLVYNQTYYPGYSPRGVGAYLSGEAPVEIIGSAPGGANAQQVADALIGPPAFRSVRFVAVGSTEKTRAQQRLAFIFSPQGAVGGNALCNSGSTKGTGQGPLRVIGAYCSGHSVLTMAYMKLDADVGPGDAAFDHAMERLIQTLLPPYNPINSEPRRSMF